MPPKKKTNNVFTQAIKKKKQVDIEEAKPKKQVPSLPAEIWRKIAQYKDDADERYFRDLYNRQARRYREDRLYGPARQHIEPKRAKEEAKQIFIPKYKRVVKLHKELNKKL